MYLNVAGNSDVSRNRINWHPENGWEIFFYWKRQLASIEKEMQKILTKAYQSTDIGSANIGYGSFFYGRPGSQTDIYLN